MGEGIEFDVILGDLVSGPAHKAAAAVDKLSNDLGKAKTELAFFEQQLALANKLGDIEGHDKFSAAVAQSSRKVFDLGNALGEVEAKAKPAASGLEKLAESAPGIAKVAAAVAAVGLALATVTAELVKGGVETALEVRAFNAQMEATFDALGKGPDAGRRTVEMLDDVARSAPQSREKLAEWTRAIEKMGVTDLGKIRGELIATASAQAILGDEGPAAYERLARKIHDAEEGHHKLTIASKELTKTIGTNLADAVAQRMGVSLEKLEQGLKAGTIDATKFGNALEETLIAKGAKGLDAMWLQGGTLTKKLAETFGELFSGVDTTPLTDALRQLIGLLDQGSPSGEAMKDGITGAFNGIIRVLGSALTEAEVWFLTMERDALAVDVAFRPIASTIWSIVDALLGVSNALNLLSVALPGGGVLGGVFGGDEELKQQGQAIQAMEAWKAASANEATVNGAAIGEGLVKGMAGAKPAVERAGHDLGHTAIVGARAGADAHSPSRKAEKLGGDIDEGLGGGMLAGGVSPRAGRQLSENALGGMTARIFSSPAANGNAASGITISGLVINITAPQGVTDANKLSATGLVLALEKLQLASGR
jgi:hypothetical protein